LFAHNVQLLRKQYDKIGPRIAWLDGALRRRIKIAKLIEIDIERRIDLRLVMKCLNAPGYDRVRCLSLRKRIARTLRLLC